MKQPRCKHNIPQDSECRECQNDYLTARKDDIDKLRYDLVPPRSLEELVRVYTFGASKYSDRNWEKGLAWGRVFAAIMRHLWAWWRGEECDPESGLHHLAHAAWGCFALLEYRHSKPGLDDRPQERDVDCRPGRAVQFYTDKDKRP